MSADLGRHAWPTRPERAAARLREELLTPIAKAWSTDIGVEVASAGVQIHGGMGYVEETGAAQHYRDARIAPIYEGTNGIQAMDLAGRKLGMAGGDGPARLDRRHVAPPSRPWPRTRSCGPSAERLRAAAGCVGRGGGLAESAARQS